MRIRHVVLGAAAVAGGALHAQSTTDVAQLPPADVSVTLSDGQSTVLAGQSIRYTLTVNNVGINGLAGVLVTTALSANLSQVTWTCRATTGSQCTSDGFGELTDSIDISSRGNVRYSISAVVSPTASGSVSVSVSAATPSGYVDLTPENNIATDTDPVFDEELIFSNAFDG